MQTKALELRDEMTFIPILCVNMNPKLATNTEALETATAQRWLLRRCGYPCNGRPNILMTRLSADGYATNDPYGWPGGSQTFPVAHNWIIEHWNELKDGDVVDVEFILGKTLEPKISERFTT